MAMDAIKLPLTKRDVKVKAKKLRAQGLIPAVLYGHGTENHHLAVPYNVFTKAFKAAGESTLLDLELEGNGTVKGLVKDWQVDPLSNRYTHVDFYQVNLKEKLKVTIALNFVGESAAVKEQGGSLVKSMDSLRVECLPGDLVHNIDVDVSVLKSFDDMIHVSDLKLPEGIEVLEDANAVVVLVEAPMTEDQLKALENAAPVDVTAIKTEAEEKKAAEEAAKAAEEAAKE
ncbi:MAG: 50S ribosomal protein L25 [Patescibacteria group bacterium]|nr:MAG: 50S ribosomal protein L25 [Patescibacteria group bacterium]